MTQTVNDLGQPIGFAVEGWKAVARPPRESMAGRYCRVEPIRVEPHAAQLFEANRADTEGRLWTYLPYGPFDSLADYQGWLARACLGDDPLFYAIVDLQTGQAAGVASYLRIDPANGVIEVGHINYSPRLQRSPAATEAMYLMMRGAFELGYRRYEWKCDSLNQKSRRAAQRFGFSYEGIFRQATIYKGRNRDTAWYACIEAEWPALQAAYQQWLDSANFDDLGQQRLRLTDLTAPILKLRG